MNMKNISSSHQISSSAHKARLAIKLIIGIGILLLFLGVGYYSINSQKEQDVFDDTHLEIGRASCRERV